MCAQPGPGWINFNFLVVIPVVFIALQSAKWACHIKKRCTYIHTNTRSKEGLGGGNACTRKASGCGDSPSTGSAGRRSIVKLALTEVVLCGLLLLLWTLLSLVYKNTSVLFGNALGLRPFSFHIFFTCFYFVLFKY